MDLSLFHKKNDYLWEIPKSFRYDMRVPARIYASEKILRDTEIDAINQLINTTTLPGIKKYAIAMPDIHSGYGPPIGGVGAIDLSDGIISPGFVGYDQNCGVRLLFSEYKLDQIDKYLERLAIKIQKEVPSGLGRGRKSKLSIDQLNKVLEGGVPYLIEKGYGRSDDIENCEEGGKMKDADASCVSIKAKERGSDQLGTLGSGNHFCEIQKVSEILNEETAKEWGIFTDQIVIMIHTGSRGLGHQNCTDHLKIISQAMLQYNINLPDRELACVPFKSIEGQNFYRGLSAACNFAWANRQMITYYIRKAWNEVLENKSELKLLYDVAHNIAKIENHKINDKEEKVIIHRKGATRAFPPNHIDIPLKHKKTGQVVLIPGSMGTASYILSGTETSNDAWYTTCHGAGRRMSRSSALRTIRGEDVIKNLQSKGIIVKCQSKKGMAEEAPEVYKDINEVINVVDQAGLAKKVAKLIPLAVIKGE